MTKVAVEKIPESNAPPASILDKMLALTENVQKRAYELFQRRGDGDGSALGDWLQAERDTIFSPEADLIENDGQYHARLAVPGFEAKDLQVTAMPDALIIMAESSHRHEKNEGQIHVCEFGQKTLFRRLPLPTAINTDKVTASLDHGILQLTAEKAAQATSKVTVTSAA